MAWDLFVDESGKFDKDEPSLIGGFIVPRGTVKKEDVIRWNEKIRNQIVKEGLLQSMSNYAEEPQEKNKNISAPLYCFEHCCRNKTSDLRWQVQTRVLELYAERIQEAGGKIVIFSNPDGDYNETNTQTYLTVLVRGLMWLAVELMKNNNGYLDEVYLYGASRQNMDQSGNINIDEYKKQMKMLAMLYGGVQLLNITSFRDMINNMHIIEGDKESAERKKANTPREPAHPITVPCDYISNCFLAKQRRVAPLKKRMNTIYDSAMFFDFRYPLPSADFSFSEMADNHSWDAGFKRLISMGFPNDKTELFFEGMNNDRDFDQSNCIETANSYIRPMVKDGYAMHEVIKRIKLIISKADLFGDINTRKELIVSMNLFLVGAYNHLKDLKNLNETILAAENGIKELPEMVKKIEYIMIITNRKIVVLTDLFRFDEALETFEKLDRYWKGYRIVAQTLIQEELSGCDTSTYVEYGRELGSYFQLMKWFIRRKKDLFWYEEAKSHFEDARNCFSKKSDIARYWMNRCDLEMEAGNFEESFNCLYQSALLSNNEDESENAEINEDNCKKILEICGPMGMYRTFLYSHYARLVRAMIKADRVEGEMMIRMAWNNGISVEKYKQLSILDAKIHLAWWIASALGEWKGSTKQQRGVAVGLLDAAIEDVLNEGSILLMVDACIYLADKIQLMMRNLLPGGDRVENEAKEKMKKILKQIRSYPDFEPFEGMKPEEAQSIEDYIQIADSGAF